MGKGKRPAAAAGAAEAGAATDVRPAKKGRADADKLPAEWGESADGVEVCTVCVCVCVCVCACVSNYLSD
jgi:hypothetical protein